MVRELSNEVVKECRSVGLEKGNHVCHFDPRRNSTRVKQHNGAKLLLLRGVKYLSIGGV